MIRFVAALFLLAFACMLAGVYGMVHNQISFTVGPDYFSRFKFVQFGISEALPPRFGAAIVGWQASWWMGLAIAAPIVLVAVFLPDSRLMVRHVLRATLIVLGLTLLLGLASLAIPLDESHAELFRLPANVEDPVGFIRAGLMHDVSYGAGLLGLAVGLVYMIAVVVKARRAA